MKIVKVYIDNKYSTGGLMYKTEIADVKKITDKMVMLNGNIDYTSRFNKTKLDKCIFDNGYERNNFSSKDLRVKYYTLCEDDEVEQTNERLKGILLDFSLKEITRRKRQIDELEDKIRNLRG